MEALKRGRVVPLSSDEEGWSVIVMKPMRLLVTMNAVVATGLFALGVYWEWTSPASLGWSLQAIAVAGFLSLVSFAGAWLNRH